MQGESASHAAVGVVPAESPAVAVAPVAVKRTATELADLFDQLLVLDLGSDEWRCGWAEDSGPEVVVRAPEEDKDFLPLLSSVFEELRADPSQCAVLVSEPPGTSAPARMRVARTLFESHRVPALWIVAAPLLALFNAERETVVMVDVADTVAFILTVHLGHAVVEACTAHPLVGENASSSALHEAILATVDLCDVSIRAELLANVFIVGKGSRDKSFAARLRTDLASMSLARDPRWRRRHWRQTASGVPDAPATALLSTRRSVVAGKVVDVPDYVHTPWKASVIANAERVLAAWLGGAVVGSMHSAQVKFIERVDFEANPALLHMNCMGLPCETLEALQAKAVADAKAEAEAAASERVASRKRASQAAEGARSWHSEQQAALSAEARAQRRALQLRLLSGVAWWSWKHAVKSSSTSPPPAGLFVPAAVARIQKRFPPPYSVPPPIELQAPAAVDVGSSVEGSPVTVMSPSPTSALNLSPAKRGLGHGDERPDDGFAAPMVRQLLEQPMVQQLLEQSKQVATQWQAQVTRCWQSAAAAGADEQRYESPSRASPNRGEYAFGSREPRRRILGRSPPLSP